MFLGFGVSGFRGFGFRSLGLYNCSMNPQSLILLMEALGFGSQAGLA